MNGEIDHQAARARESTERRGTKRPHNRDNSRSSNVSQTKQQWQQHPLVQSLRKIDPLLQFLTKATGHVLIPWTLVQKSLPVQLSLSEVQALEAYGVLRLVQEEPHHDADPMMNHPDDGSRGNGSSNAAPELPWKVGFPPPPLTSEATEASSRPKAASTSTGKYMLHGSTKRAAQQRLQWLQKQLRESSSLPSSTSASSTSSSPQNTKGRAVQSHEVVTTTTQTRPFVVTPEMLANPVRSPDTTTPTTTILSPPACLPPVSPVLQGNLDWVENDALDSTLEERKAITDLRNLMQWPEHDESTKGEPVCIQSKSAAPTCILPRQVAFAGSHAAQPAIYAELPAELSVPPDVLAALTQNRSLYQHQVQAIQAALQNQHVSLTTGTGSGKSMAFLMPVLSKIIQEQRTALLLFPTKALAQDQITKLQALAQRLDNPHALRAATLDGDTPHSQRQAVAQTANLILTNPDTLHASILPQWKRYSNPLLANLAFVVIDEAHSYQGIFGAHVSLILARLRRVCAIARAQHQHDDKNHGNSGWDCLRFIAASATLPWPEAHVRKLCPIAPKEAVAVIEQDTSPRAAKHFFVWNPPILSAQGVSSGSVTHGSRKKNPTTANTHFDTQPKTNLGTNESELHEDCADEKIVPIGCERRQPREPEWHRRHSADETALLLARAVVQGVRCMAFAKTRNLVEWIFERTLAALKADPNTKHLANKVESYRGGYTRAERRKIEERLFRNELLGVVGTNALELGVDVGGIDLTLHCGYPSSYASLLQQAGRAGRGRSHAISCSVVVCFNSPSEQHLWRHPSNLLSKGLAPIDTIPLNNSTVQGHLLCASNEFPLTGNLPAESIVTESSCDEYSICDCSLFGGEKFYEGALSELVSAGSCITEVISTPSIPKLTLYKAHPLMKKAWSLVSIRSIEPVNYSIVDLSHPVQGGRTDGIYSEQAVLDILPYSRVFYHAHPGAIITHRGTRYKIVSMTRPPDVLTSQGVYFRRNLQLSAFAKPTSARYSTRPLSNTHITIIKQFESVELISEAKKTIFGEHSGTDDPLSLLSDLVAEHSEDKAIVAEDVDKFPTQQSCQANGSLTNSTCRRLLRNQKETGTAEVEKSLEQLVHKEEGELDKEAFISSFSGCGAINVKRTVHGYKKLSLITRTEISRSELSLPDMEFDTFGLWFDTDTDLMTSFLGSKYGEGVHALSHALLAVAPLFEPGLVRDDLECDHSYYRPTRLCLFDERAGGSGSCERLWKHFFVPENNILDAALDLLRNCDSCANDIGYEGGCPACLHASQCLKFNMNLSRSAAVIIGQHMLDRIKSTDLYKFNEQQWKDTKQPPESPPRNLTPRRKARRQALKKAKEMKRAQGAQYVVGRPSWPDGDSFGYCQEHG